MGLSNEGRPANRAMQPSNQEASYLRADAPPPRGRGIRKVASCSCKGEVGWFLLVEFVAPGQWSCWSELVLVLVGVRVHCARVTDRRSRLAKSLLGFWRRGFKSNRGGFCGSERAEDPVSFQGIRAPQARVGEDRTRRRSTNQTLTLSSPSLSSRRAE